MLSPHNPRVSRWRSVKRVALLRLCAAHGASTFALAIYSTVQVDKFARKNGPQHSIAEHEVMKQQRGISFRASPRRALAMSAH
jgi:hypothetical protein